MGDGRIWWWFLYVWSDLQGGRDSQVMLVMIYSVWSCFSTSYKQRFHVYLALCTLMLRNGCSELGWGQSITHFLAPYTFPSFFFFYYFLFLYNCYAVIVIFYLFYFYLYESKQDIVKCRFFSLICWCSLLEPTSIPPRLKTMWLQKVIGAWA